MSKGTRMMPNKIEIETMLAANSLFRCSNEENVNVLNPIGDAELIKTIILVNPSSLRSLPIIDDTINVVNIINAAIIGR